MLVVSFELQSIQFPKILTAVSVKVSVKEMMALFRSAVLFVSRSSVFYRGLTHDFFLVSLQSHLLTGKRIMLSKIKVQLTQGFVN